jgi:hypothetical protein
VLVRFVRTVLLEVPTAIPSSRAAAHVGACALLFEAPLLPLLGFFGFPLSIDFCLPRLTVVALLLFVLLPPLLELTFPSADPLLGICFLFTPPFGLTGAILCRRDRCKW